MRTFLLSLVLLLWPLAAIAIAPAPTLSSEIWVERVGKDGNGNVIRTLEKPLSVLPGDVLFFEIVAKNTGSQSNNDFVITNPMPRAVNFVSASDNADYSVDGGKSWGDVPSLRVALPNGSQRAADLSDVTHVRWRAALPLQPGEARKFSFRARVK